MVRSTQKYIPFWVRFGIIMIATAVLTMLLQYSPHHGDDAQAYHTNLTAPNSTSVHVNTPGHAAV